MGNNYQASVYTDPGGKATRVLCLLCLGVFHEALTSELRKDFPQLAFKEPVDDGPNATLCGECGASGDWDNGEVLPSVQFFKCHYCFRVWVEV